MFEAPVSDSIREINNTIFHKSAILHLYETSVFTFFEEDVDSRILTVAHLSPNSFIASKGPDLFADD
jgi:hypothetical protein